MKNPLSGLFRARDKPRDAVSPAEVFYFGSSVSGKTVNPRNAVQVSTVYACVRVIAETIASLPVSVYEDTGSGSRKATEHPLQRLLHDEPNSEMTSFVWRETMLSHLLLWGNSYSQIVRSGKTNILSLYPLLPDRMEVDRDSKGNLTYTYTTTEGNQISLKPSDVLHIPGLGFDGVVGYSPIALEKNAIGLGIAAEEYGSTFFKTGARPSGILTHPNSVKDPKRLRESWNAAYGGSTNGNKVAILEEGMTFAPVSIPNNEAQFLETRKFQVEEICRIYRVPPHLIGDLSRSTFSNIEHQSIDFATHTIRPWLVRIEHSAGIVDHEQRAGRHFQPVGGHSDHRCSGSCRAGDGNHHVSGIGTNIVEHTDSGIAGAAIAVQANMHILGERILRAVQQVVQGFRGDFISEPALIVDVAVQAQFSQWAFLLDRLLDFWGSGCASSGGFSSSGSSSIVDTAEASMVIPASPTGTRLPLHR